jgi:hypothetical protein
VRPRDGEERRKHRRLVPLERRVDLGSRPDYGFRNSLPPEPEPEHRDGFGRRKAVAILAGVFIAAALGVFFA